MYVIIYHSDSSVHCTIFSCKLDLRMIIAAIMYAHTVVDPVHRVTTFRIIFKMCQMDRLLQTASALEMAKQSEYIL